MKTKLKKISENLKKFYQFTHMSPSIVFVRKKNNDELLAQLLLLEEFPNEVVVSLAINYSNSTEVAVLIHDLMHITSIKIAEPFFESNSGEISYGETAEQNKLFEKDAEFLKETPASNIYPI